MRTGIGGTSGEPGHSACTIRGAQTVAGGTGGLAWASVTRVPGTMGTGSPSACSRLDGGGGTRRQHGWVVVGDSAACASSRAVKNLVAGLVEGLSDLVARLVEGLTHLVARLVEGLARLLLEPAGLEGRWASPLMRAWNGPAPMWCAGPEGP